MKFFTHDQLNELMQVRQFPLVSLYLPVEKVTNDTRQGPKVLRKLLKSAEESLKEKGVRTPDIESLLAPAQALLNDAMFWEKQNLGLALFLSKDGMAEHRLPIRFSETMLVADRYLVRPLLSMIGQDGRYAILALSLNDVHLYIASRYSMMEVVLTPNPKTLDDVMNSYDTENNLSHTSGSTGGRPGTGGFIMGGSFSPKEEEKLRILEFFRAVDLSLRKSLTDEKMPVVLACVDYLVPLFREASKDARVMDENISGSAENMKRDDILAAGWQIVRPVFEKEKNRAVEAVQNALNSPLIQQDVRKILMAAQNGQVDTLLLQQGKTLIDSVERANSPYSATSGPVHVDEEELFDFAAAKVMAQGGKVFVLPSGEMPNQADCIALLRYQA